MAKLRRRRGNVLHPIYKIWSVVKGSTTWTKTPCVLYREDSIKRHQDSNCHRIAMDLDRTRISSESSGGINQALQEAVTIKNQAFCAALRCMYFLLRKEIPHTTNYGDLLDLAEDIAFSYLSSIRGEDKRYQSFRIMQEMVTCIGDTVTEDVVNGLQSSPFFSILIDETTDVAILKQLIVYVKFMRGSTIEAKFLTIEDLPDGKADTIVQRLKDVFQDLNIPLHGRLAALGNDGAAVMVGCRNGVSTQLRQESSILMNNHCVAHRLALAVRETAEHIPEIKRFNRHLMDLKLIKRNSDHHIRPSVEA